MNRNYTITARDSWAVQPYMHTARTSTSSYRAVQLFLCNLNWRGGPLATDKFCSILWNFVFFCRYVCALQVRSAYQQVSSVQCENIGQAGGSRPSAPGLKLWLPLCKGWGQFSFCQDSRHSGLRTQDARLAASAGFKSNDVRWWHVAHCPRNSSKFKTMNGNTLTWHLNLIWNSTDGIKLDLSTYKLMTTYRCIKVLKGSVVDFYLAWWLQDFIGIIVILYTDLILNNFPGL